MTEKNYSAFLWVISIAVIVCLVMSFVSMSMISNKKFNFSEEDQDSLAKVASAYVLANLPAQEEVIVPSAEEIASKIVIPSVEIPDVYDEMHDLWEDLYSDEIDEIEAESEEDSRLELEDDDFDELEEFLEVEIEGFDELNDVDEREMEVKVLQLGLDDEDDKEADVYFKLKVKYELLEGTDDDYKKYVYAHYNVLYDEGDFDDEDVSLVEFSFEEPAIFA